MSWDIRRLDGRERERWREPLSAEPLLARPEIAPTATGIVSSVVGAIALAATARLARPALDDDGSLALWVAALPLAYGISVALLVHAGFGVVRAARLARAPFPCGRFLFSWGYAEVEPASLALVYGRDLRVEVSATSRAGVPASTVVLRTEAWSTTFDVLHVPDDLAAALHALSPGPTLGEGYRHGTSTPARARSRPARACPFFAALVSGTLVALGSYALVVPAQLIAQAEQSSFDARPWWAIRGALPLHPEVVARADAELDRRYAVASSRLAALPSWHELSLRQWLGGLSRQERPVVHFDDRCVVSEQDAAAIDRYVESRAGRARPDRVGGVSFSRATRHVRGRLREILAPDSFRWSTSSLEPHEAGWSVTCRFVPVGLVEEGGWARAAVRTTVSVQLRVYGQPSWTDERDFEESALSGAIPRSTTSARYDAWADSTTRRIAAFLAEWAFEARPPRPPSHGSTRAAPR